MPKYSINDIHKRTIELDEGLLEMHNRQLAQHQAHAELEHVVAKKISDVNTTAIAGLVIGSISLVVILCSLALS